MEILSIGGIKPCVVSLGADQFKVKIIQSNFINFNVLVSCVRFLNKQSSWLHTLPCSMRP